MVSPDNPWIGLSPEPPYVLEDDRKAVEAHNTRARGPRKLDLDLLPFPFLGNPEGSLVLLNLNPGIDPGDYLEQEHDDFRAAYRRNLQHLAQPYPFFLFDPAFERHPGNRFWSKHLRQLIDYAGAQALSRELLVLEWIPYASEETPLNAPRLPSQAYISRLLRLAMSRDAVVLGLRALDQWFSAVPELNEYRRFHRLKPRTRRIWVTRGNLETAVHFDDILSCLPRQSDAPPLLLRPLPTRRSTTRQAPARPRAGRRDPTVEADFAALRAEIESLGDDIDAPQRRGRGASLAYNRKGCRQFVCITQQARTVKVETIDESLAFNVAFHVGGGKFEVEAAAAALRRAYECGALRRR